MRVRVHAVGMASCLGAATPACAAFRANLFQPSQSPDAEVAEPGDETPQAVTVCSAPVSTFGFSGVGRLVALTCEALKDLWSRVDLATLASNTGFFFALPDPRERGLELGDLDESLQDRLDELGTRILKQSLRNLGLTWKGPLRFFGGGHIAFAQALHAAQAELMRRSMKSCVVMGLDCLVEEGTLQSLASEERLKSPARPTGLVPGEAGAALLLTTEPSSNESRSKPTVELRAIRTGSEPFPRGADKPSDGRALAECARTALAADGPLQGTPLLVSDHNGEEWRAREWGMALIQLRTLGLTFEAPPTWYPAIGFGEVGAASGAVGACLAIRGLERGYAPATSCLVMSCADDAGRAAFLLSAAPHPLHRGAKS
ncbi:hypothetical protein DRW03_24630 [Corallococcus sp. H22C18031201]|nr:hypothetical protein DRW03_24630 [Corallococcus sp. H22C18031201]